MHRSLLLSSLLVLISAASSRVTTGAEYVFPPDSGVVDVTQPPYRADRSGRADATAALQRAISDNFAKDCRILYLPDGTYRVSETLCWGSGSTMGPLLWGQSRNGVEIRLQDNCKGFEDPAKRRAVIWTGDGSADNFIISVRSLSISTGRGNPGACGLQYMANNQGTVQDVRIVSGDGRGAVGLDMAYTDMVGPALIKNVEIEGFDTGILTGHTVNSAVFEHVTLRAQREVGFHNTGQCVSIRDLQYEGPATAVRNDGGPSFMVLIDSQFTGTQGAARLPAIVNERAILVRDIRTLGYRDSLASGEDVLQDRDIDEYVSHRVERLFASPPQTLSLPIEETPTVPWGDSRDWANVARFGADATDDRDDTAAIQKAIDSGAHTIFLPHVSATDRRFEEAGCGRDCYRIEGTVHIRGNVRRIIGASGNWKMLNIIGAQKQPAFIVEDGEAPTVVIENLCTWDLSPGGRRTVVRHESRQTLVVRHVNGLLNGGALYRAVPGCGKAFFEDVSVQFPGNGTPASDAPAFYFCKGQRVWARQMNPEKVQTKIVNDGADLWILGLKVERGSTLIDTRAGGRTEVLGGLCYTGTDPGTQPMFAVEDASLSASIAEAGFHARFDVVISETRREVTRTIKRTELPGRCQGSMIPLYTGYIVSDAASVSPPRRPRAEAASTSQIEVSWAEPRSGKACEYVIYRDGKRIGSTTRTTFTDTGLADDRSYSYDVAALNLAMNESSRASARARTKADTRRPRLVDSVAYRDPERVRLTFDEALDADAASRAKNYTLSGKARVLSARLLPDCKTVTLETKGLADRNTILVTAVVDTATRPNAVSMNAPVPVRWGREVKTYLSMDFEGPDPLQGIQDNGGWRGGKATFGTLKTGDGNTLMEMKGTNFAQVVLGRVPLGKGTRYQVSLDMQNNGPSRPVQILLRQMDAPWTAYAAHTLQLASADMEKHSFQFESAHDDPWAVLFLIADGDSALFMDNIRIADAEQ